MKKATLFFILMALALAACGGRAESVTDRMQASMQDYAKQYDAWYPDAARNVAQICMEAPGLIFRDEGLTAVTCALYEDPGNYGVVTFDHDENVLDVFSVQAGSDGDLVRVMRSAGWK